MYVSDTVCVCVCLTPWWRGIRELIINSPPTPTPTRFEFLIARALVSNREKAREFQKIKSETTDIHRRERESETVCVLDALTFIHTHEMKRESREAWTETDAERVIIFLSCYRCYISVCIRAYREKLIYRPIPRLQQLETRIYIHDYSFGVDDFIS